LVESPASYTVETFTASDGYRCRYRRYAPPAAPRGHMVCIHGIQSHAGWYESSCTRLSQAGYIVSFLDRRGAGLNEPARGDTPNYRRLLDDLAEFLQALRPPPSPRHPVSPSPRHPVITPLPVFLLAISWGGKLAVALEAQHPRLVDGLVLLCPGFFPRVGPSLGERLTIAWARLVSPQRLFPVPLQDAELFTATPRWQKFIHDDPLSLRQATARFFVASVFLDRALRSAPRQVRIPVLLLLAGKDRIIDNDLTRRYIDRFATDDKELIEYPAAGHTLEFEDDPNPFIEDIRRWLDCHSAIA
jgi:alpha-beta hydrolase superfamily lysophospholipase